MATAVETRFGKRTVRYRPGARPFSAGGTRQARGSRMPLYRPVSPPRAAPSPRLAGLDLLRLVAALAVVMFHFGYAGPTRGFMQTAFPELAGLARYGFIGVDLFFLISGFVIAASVEGRTWRAFAISRLIRLYPAHVFCMSVTAAVLTALAAPGGGPTVIQWLANLTMFAPALGQPFMDGAYWSIVIEIVFYGWVGVFIALGLFQRRLLSIIAVWLAIAFVNESLFQWRPLRLGLITEYAGMFASGILIHRIRLGERGLATFVLLGFAVALGALHAFEAQRVVLRLYADTLDTGLLWVLHAAIYAIFCGALCMSSRLAATPLVLTLGGLTYPLYLVHQNAGYALIDHLAPGLGRWPALAVTLAAALALAWIACRLVEPGGRDLIRRALRNFAAHGQSPIGVTPAPQ
mgnify:CR=1 FL=1